jgi:uncharacterized membrane protein YdjX (TVP38/TMEM64 family)
MHELAAPPQAQQPQQVQHLNLTSRSAVSAVAPASARAARFSARTVGLIRLAATSGLIVAVALLYLLHDGVRTEVGHALAVLGTGNGTAIGDYLLSYGVWAPLASIFLMIVQAVAAPVPAIFVAFANGLAFGVFWGGLLTVTGQTIAAAICFAIARSLGRGPVEALAGKFGMEAADRWFTRWGARGIFITRLIPGISFDVVSYGAGLTGIGFGPFITATALGVAPQAFLYAYLIREAPQSAWIFYLVSWAVVALIVTGAVIRARRKSAVSQRVERASTAQVATCSTG